MSKRMYAALLGMGVAACLAAPAQARVDNGPVSSLYDADSRRAPAHQAQRTYRGKSAVRSSKGRKAAYRGASQGSKKGRAARLAGRSVTASHSGGGGASRGCLTSAARALLGRIEAQFGAVQVISTCRPGARIAGSGKPSKHASGNAVDFNAGGRKAAIVNWLRANHHSGGTMTYARMNHIHVDIGPRFVSLGSGGGKARRRG